MISIKMGYRLHCGHTVVRSLCKRHATWGLFEKDPCFFQLNLIRWYGLKPVKTTTLEDDGPIPNDVQTAIHAPNNASEKTCTNNSPSPVHNAAMDVITVFHKPTRHSFNVPMEDPVKDFSLVINKSNRIINLNFNEKFWNEVKKTKVSVDVKGSSSEDVSLNSIDELIWKPIKIDKTKLLSYYMNLSKFRLTGLVVLTAMAGYGIAPGAFNPGTFALCTLGTTLTSSSANAINQFLEVPYDSQMNRTKNRVIVRGLLTPLHAVGFATVSGAVGLTILGLGVNPLTAALGAFNLGVYTLVYTPMKRMHIANTWVGSIVGAIPPMMGWAASAGTIDAGAFLLGAILYAWQFPHFNALSWNLRPDYSRAGYQMCSVINPNMCKRVALRYSAGMIVLCTLAPVLDVTTWTFAIDSLPVNLYLTYLAWRFYRNGDSKSSRNLFRFSLIHIPAILVLMLISKKTYEKRKDVEAIAPGAVNLISVPVSS